MLTSAGSKGDAARCSELGMQACLSKPIKRVDLLEAIELALLGPREAIQPSRHAAPALAQQRHFKILLAEDNLVNQKSGCAISREARTHGLPGRVWKQSAGRLAGTVL